MKSVKIYLSVAAFLTLTLAAAMWAQSEAQAQPEPAASTPEQAPEAAKGEAEDDGEFVPSEEISEDLSVSFPVDI